MAYLRFRNMIMTPTIWALVTELTARVLGVQTSWRIWALIVVSCLVQDFIDAVVEDRPVAGPYRWKKRPSSKE